MAWTPLIMSTLVIRTLGFIVTHIVLGEIDQEILFMFVSLEGMVEPRPPLPPKAPNHLPLSPQRHKPHSLRGRRATLSDLVLIRVKYNIPSEVELRVPRKDKTSERPSTTSIALHIDLFDFGLRLPLQLFLRRMLSYLQITLRQLSLPA